MTGCDVLVIGGGIAGVSLGYELAEDHSVVLLEMESTLAYHATGRSAATFLESYGGPVIRALTTASRAYLEDPPDGFDPPLLTPLTLLWLGPAGTAADIRRLHAEVSPLVPDVELLGPSEAEKICPVLRPGYVELAMLEPGAREVDVSALHAGYRRGLLRRGGKVITSAPVSACGRRGAGWEVSVRGAATYRADVVINAAGAWCDEVAHRAGAAAVGIRPLRRTVFTIAAPTGFRSAGPLIADIGGTFYVKPEGAGFLCSAAEETPQPPGDARPDPVEIARALDAINAATVLGARAVRRSWAGLRSFAPDRVPVVGYDPTADGFFWFAGQGGYGIQTAPALARTGAALVHGQDVPPDAAGRGVTAAALSPGRFPPLR